MPAQPVGWPLTRAVPCRAVAPPAGPARCSPRVVFFFLFPLVVCCSSSSSSSSSWCVCSLVSSSGKDTRERFFFLCLSLVLHSSALSLFSSLRKAWKLPFSSPFVCLLITSFQHIGSRSSPESYPSLKQQQKTCQVPEAELISSLNFFFCRKTERYERVERIERFERTERIERDRDRDREITYRICSPDNFFPELARRNSAAACSGFQKALTRIQKQANFAIRQLRRRRRQINLHSPCVNHQKKKFLIIGLKLMRTSF